MFSEVPSEDLVFLETTHYFGQEWAPLIWAEKFVLRLMWSSLLVLVFSGK